MGISRRIGAVPNDFRIGEDVVYLAHVDAVPGAPGEEWQPGIFRSFRPTGVDLVIDDPDHIPAEAVRPKEKYGNKAQTSKVVSIERHERE